MKSLFKCCLTVLLSLPVILACQISRDITTNQDRETADRMPSSMGEGNTIRHHHLEIHIDPASGTISISDLVEFHLDSEEVKVDLHENMQIQSLTYGSEPLEFVVEPHDKGLNSVVIQVPKERIGESFQARFQYSGSIPKVDFSDGRHRGVEVAPYLNSDEAVLLSNGHWYPVISEQKSLITYSLTVHTPPGWETISAGTKIQQDPALFEMGHPIDDINLISGRFHVKKGTAGNVGLMTYFKKEDPDMEKKYLSAMKAHLEEFETRFGAYPYESLSLVASPLMEGIGFPGFIMMGERLLSIRNMERISLGHEILHNWWGNGVYPDWEEGNWTEGLITYLVDHAFSVRKIGKPGARAELIEGYSLYTQTGKEPSLTEFKQRERPQDMAVGYYKAAFVFSMLEDHLGKDRFDQALRNFRDAMMFKVASWNDLESAFDATSEDSLNDFFERWVQGVGAPEIRILEAHIVSGSGGREVELILASDPVFQIQLPITITSATSTTQEKVTISRSPQTIRLKAATAIRTIKVDPEYSVLRKFLPEELPITLSSALEEDIDLPVVFSSSLNKEQVAIYKHFLQVSQVVYHQVDTVSETMGPVVIMGYPSASGEIGGWVPKDVPWKWAGSSLSIGDATISRGKDTAAFAWRGPKGASQPVAWIVGYSREGLESLSMRLGYFLSSSYVMLQEGKKPVRDEWKSDAKPLEIEFADAKPDQV